MAVTPGAKIEQADLDLLLAKASGLEGAPFYFLPRRWFIDAAFTAPFFGQPPWTAGIRSTLGGLQVGEVVINVHTQSGIYRPVVKWNGGDPTLQGSWDAASNWVTVANPTQRDALGNVDDGTVVVMFLSTFPPGGVIQIRRNGAWFTYQGAITELNRMRYALGRRFNAVNPVVSTAFQLSARAITSRKYWHQVISGVAYPNGDFSTRTGDGLTLAGPARWKGIEIVTPIDAVGAWQRDIILAGQSFSLGTFELSHWADGSTIKNGFVLTGPGVIGDLRNEGVAYPDSNINPFISSTATVRNAQGVAVTPVQGVNDIHVTMDGPLTPFATATLRVQGSQITIYFRFTGQLTAGEWWLSFNATIDGGLHFDPGFDGILRHLFFVSNGVHNALTLRASLSPTVSPNPPVISSKPVKKWGFNEDQIGIFPLSGDTSGVIKNTEPQGGQIHYWFNGIRGDPTILFVLVAKSIPISSASDDIRGTQLDQLGTYKAPGTTAADPFGGFFPEQWFSIPDPVQPWSVPTRSPSFYDNDNGYPKAALANVYPVQEHNPAVPYQPFVGGLPPGNSGLPSVQNSYHISVIQSPYGYGQIIRIKVVRLAVDVSGPLSVDVGCYRNQIFTVLATVVMAAGERYGTWDQEDDQPGILILEFYPLVFRSPERVQVYPQWFHSNRAVNLPLGDGTLLVGSGTNTDQRPFCRAISPLMLAQHYNETERLLDM